MNSEPDMGTNNDTDTDTDSDTDTLKINTTLCLFMYDGAETICHYLLYL